MKKKQEFFSNAKKGNLNHIEWVYSNNGIISGFPDLFGNEAPLFLALLWTIISDFFAES